MKGKYSFFTSRELKPRGWLRRQLEIEAAGLCGNLDKVWPDVRDSAWIGGDREGWERVPYWLDGAVPLAYLLDDKDLISRTKRYIDSILARQEEDGWICPVAPEERKNYDTWAILLISKVLLRYYECSGDERVPSALYRLMKNFAELLEEGKVSLARWGRYRWFEGFPALNFLYSRQPEEWIKVLAKRLAAEGKDYRTVEKAWERPLNKWTFDTHIVNLCMMLKSEVLSADLIGKELTGFAEREYSVLRRFNGTAVGTFTGDECLSGTSPTQGTELCAVVELMDSMEQLYAFTGAPEWAERLETVAFNALPATLTEDMWAHQYVQTVNQIDCTPFPGRSHFRTNGPSAHIFGLEPHFGCCTANFGQGYPKLALSTFLRAEDGIICAIPLPSEVNTAFCGVPVRVTLESDYPFRNSFRLLVRAEKKTDMTLSVRIPSFAHGLTVNGKQHRAQNGILRFEGFDKGLNEITVSFTAEPHLCRRPKGMSVLRYGSLVFSLPIRAEVERVEYEKKGVERKFPYCDYNYRGVSDWNLAFASRNFRVSEHPIGDIPFSESNPPLTIDADLAHVEWGFEDGFETVPARSPKSRRPIDAPRGRRLIPYGCTMLRMTELPVLLPDGIISFRRQ